MRQMPSAFGAAFSAALIPPFWRRRMLDRSPPWTTRCRSGDRPAFVPGHPARRQRFAVFQAGGFPAQNLPWPVRPASNEAAPFQTYFYSGVSCLAVTVPGHTSDPALKSLRPPLALILAHPDSKRLCRSCNVLSAFAGRRTLALPAQRQKLRALMKISIV